MIMIVVIVINYVLLSRFNIWMGNGPDVPVVCAWEVRLAICSTFVPATSAIVRGLSFSRSQTDLTVFLWLIQFSSLSKSDSQSKTCGLGAVLWDLA